MSSITDVLKEISDFPVKPAIDGIKILGVPFGSETFFTLTQKVARQVDKDILEALENYWGWPEMPEQEHAPRYNSARYIVRQPLREGGFGLTAVAGTCLPAFYRAAALSIRWICNSRALINILKWDLDSQPRNFNNTFLGEFLDAEEALLCSACKRPDDFTLKPPGAVALLPDWAHLINPREDETFFPIPPQRVIVQTYLSSMPKDAIVQHLTMNDSKLQIVCDHSSSVLKGNLGLSHQQLKTTAIAYNLMAFLMAIPVTKWQLFPKHLFQLWVRLALDLPFDMCASGAVRLKMIPGIIMQHARKAHPKRGIGDMSTSLRLWQTFYTHHVCHTEQSRRKFLLTLILAKKVI